MQEQHKAVGQSVAAHTREIERCNQRGGRMLSLVDLLRARTVDIDLAAYLAAAVSRAASFLVGAVPGGLGKTTVMAALLNFVPPEYRLVAADSGATVRGALADPAGGKLCFICHEIGSGPYFAYLWGRDACDFFRLTSVGHMIATNRHADTLEQCRDQLCVENGVAADDFHRCRLCIFLTLSGGGWSSRDRRVAAVYESDGRNPHRPIWKWNSRLDHFERLDDSQIVPPGDDYLRNIHGLLLDMKKRELYSIADVRRRFLAFAVSQD